MKNNKLHSIKSSGFKYPDNYFESLDELIFSQIAEENVSFKVKSSGFKVSDDYFETVDSKIINSIEKRNHSNTVSMIDWKKVAYISGIAASLMIAFNVLFNTTTDVSFDDLETASIQNYLINEDLTAYDLAPYLGNIVLDSDVFVDKKVNSSDIEDYLLQNSDVEQLITD